MTEQGSTSTIIIGGGLIGLCTAFELIQLGHEVTVVDRASAGSGAARGNAGEITPLTLTPLAGPGMIAEMFRGVFSRKGPLSVSPLALPSLIPFGMQFLRACRPAGVRAGMAALDQLAGGIAASFDPYIDAGIAFEGGGQGYLYTDSDPAALRVFQRTLVARAERLGLEAPHDILTGDDLHSFEPALHPNIANGFYAPSERYIEPGLFVDGLIEWLRNAGVTFIENAPVRNVASDDGGVRVYIDGDDDSLHADGAIIAAGAWSSEILRRSGVKTRITAGKGYSLTVETDTLPQRLIHSGDNRVVAIPMSGRLRIVGVMEFDGSYDTFRKDRIALLLASAGRFLRGLNPEHVTEEWVAPRPMTASGVPYIGAVQGLPGVIVAAGHNMHGLSLAPVTASIVAQLATHEKPRIGEAVLDMNAFQI